ncbi:AbrB family transcriptional regulator [Egicoccus sp. AB-alg2]|uniref:AbrB family transcriptional regulator n=1 Tax=Egicoccus sp. AB-alg2 TaxID=3242693 RepID=UPI00359D94DE
MHLLTTILAAVAGAAAFEALKVPAGALVGSMAAVAVVNLTGFEVAHLPGWARFAAFTAIGWIIGQGLDRQVLASLGERVGVIVACVVALLAVGGLLTWLLVHFGIVDPATAFLATSPGGLSQMAALSAAVDADAALVTTLHVVRVVVVVVAAPWVVRLLQPG